MRKLRLIGLVGGLSAVACLMGFIIFNNGEPNIYIKTFELFWGVICIPTLSYMIVEEIQ